METCMPMGLDGKINMLKDNALVIGPAHGTLGAYSNELRNQNQALTCLPMRLNANVVRQRILNICFAVTATGTLTWDKRMPKMGHVF